MPHTKKRGSVNPRFLIDSSANGPPPPSIKNNKTKPSTKLPVDIQIFRLMGNTVANSAKEYPLLFPDFVSRFISGNNDDAETNEAKLRSWKILSELTQLKQQQQPVQQEPLVETISQHTTADSAHEKTSPHVSESTSSNSLSSFLNSPSLEQRNAQQLIALAHAKIAAGGQKKLLNRSVAFNTNSLLPQPLVVGGRSISRPNTPGVPVPFVRGTLSNRANSISAAAAPATSKSLNAPVYAQLLNCSPTLSSPTAIPGTNGLLTHKPLPPPPPPPPPPDSVQRSLQLSPSLGNGDHLSSLSSNNTSNGVNISNGNVNNVASSTINSNSNNGNCNQQISAVAAMAFSRMRVNNSIPTTTRSNSIKTVPVITSTSANSFSSTRYIDPLYGVNNPASSLLCDIYRRRIAEISLFTEQTIRFEQRKANRATGPRSLTGVIGGAPLPTSSVTNHLVGAAPSPPSSPLGKYLQRTTMSPIEPRRSLGAIDVIGDQQHFSDEEDDSDSDTS